MNGAIEGEPEQQQGLAFLRGGGRSIRCHLVVNAGGQSRRMGRTKMGLSVPSTGLPLLWHVIARVQPLGVQQTVVVLSQAAELPPSPRPQAARVVRDAFPGTGALGGVATGLQVCDDWAVVVACDMPLVSVHALRLLLAMAAEQDPAGQDRWDAVVPHVGGMLQPLHALYHPRCLPAIERCLADGAYRLVSFFDQVRTRIVHEDELGLSDQDLRSFVNVNTPEEWDAALALLRTQPL